MVEGTVNTKYGIFAVTTNKDGRCMSSLSPKYFLSLSLRGRHVYVCDGLKEYGCRPLARPFLGGDK